jgi:hypothetical protein
LNTPKDRAKERIDANAIIAAAQGLTAGRPIRYLRALP